MFVVKKPESSNKTVRLPNDLIGRMDIIAAQKDISFNQLVVQCCEYALSHLPREYKFRHISVENGSAEEPERKEVGAE